jgi:resuscitation-promoting factor RpfB
MAINGTALAITGAGAAFLYAGISNKSILSVIQNVITGKSPAKATPNTADAAETSGLAGIANIAGQAAATVGGGDAQTALQNAASAKGWGTGAEWTALVQIEDEEAGFDPTAKNPDSGAYGLAQSLGHHFSGGPAPNGVNEYGGYGLTAAESEMASMGNATYQAIWMVNYIASTYGDPIAAQAFHVQKGWY